MADDVNVVPIKKKSIKQESKPDPLLNSEMGIERVLPFASWGSTEGGEIVRTNKISLDEMVEMRRRDGQARSLVRLFVLPILSALSDGEWVSPEGGDDDTAKEVQFANDLWNLPPSVGGMTSSKSQVLKRTLNGLTDGFSVFEEVRHVPDVGPLKGKITLRKLAYRDPRTIRFKVDDTGGFNGVRQVASMNGKTIDVHIPKEKCWYYTCAGEENPYYGVSLFESAYFHYEVKRKLYYIAHLAAQFAAVPGRMGKVPMGADPRKVEAFKQSLMNFAFNTSAVFPEGYEVTPFNGNSGFDFIKLIDHHNHMMSKSVVAAFIDSEQRAALVEVGTQDASTDFFVMALESIMDDIAESWSMHLMPKYIDWNFGTKKYPIFKFGQLSDGARATIKEVFQSVVTSSVLNSTPEFVRELEKKLSKSLDLPIDYDEIERQEKEAAQAEADKADAEAAQFGGENPLAPPGSPNEPEAPVDGVTAPGAGTGLPPGGQAPGGQAPGAPGAPGAPPFPPKKKKPGQQAGTEPTAALSVVDSSLDELIAAAQALFEQRPPEE